MKILLILLVSFIVSLFLIIYEKKANKGQMLKTFLFFWLVIGMFVFFTAVQLLGLLSVFSLI